MSKINPSDFLEEVYQAAIDNLLKSVVKSATVRNKIELICRCNINKAPIRFLLACLLAKIHNPNVDIRKPYTEIDGEDTYSGRYYDEKFVESLIHKHKLPCNTTTAFLTPAFRNLDRVLSTDIVLVGRPRDIYICTLDLLEAVYSYKEKSKNILQEILRLLALIKIENEQRMDQLLADLKQPADSLNLSTEEILSLLIQHLHCKGSSRLPVLIVASAYQTIKEQIGETNNQLKSHNAADKQTGAIGDVEIVLANTDRVVTCYEIKDKQISKSDIDIGLQKLSKSNSTIDNFIFITTHTIEVEVADYAKSLYEKTGIEFVILDCMGFIRHFLHFFHRQRGKFLNIYQAMVLSEPASSVSQPLKEAFLALRRAAEADRR